MEWALENGSANILTHLRELGYPIPDDLVTKYHEVVLCYLLQEYPLKVCLYIYSNVCSEGLKCVYVCDLNSTAK